MGTFRAVWVTSSNVICSSFLHNTHHKAPAESHAQLNAECTIWAVSKPREAKAFNKQRGKPAWRTGRWQQRYKIYVAGGRAGNGVGVLSRMGDPVSDMTEETDRRFVRVGVRTGRVGGPLELEVRSKEEGVWHYTFAAFFLGGRRGRGYEFWLLDEWRRRLLGRGLR